MIALIFRHTRGSSLPPSKANQTWLWGPIGGGLRLIFASFVDWLSWPKCTLKNPVLSHNEFAVSERERWWEFQTPPHTPPPPSSGTLVWKFCCCRPEDQPADSQNFFPDPETLGRLTCQNLGNVFFHECAVSIVCFFILRAFQLTAAWLNLKCNDDDNNDPDDDDNDARQNVISTLSLAPIVAVVM